MSGRKRLIYLCILAVELAAILILKNAYKKAKDKQKETGNMVYVSLGDSIARGFGLEDIENERYSSLIGNEIENKDKNNGQDENGISVYNYGVDGQTSDELLENIASGKIKEINDAGIVTICIGTNDVLGPAEDFFLAYEELFYYYGITGGYEQDSFGEAGDYNMEQAFNTYDRAAFESEYNIMQTDCKEGVENLEYNLTEIIQAIRELNPDCQIICMTLYNPYASFDYTVYTNNIQVNIAGDSEELIENANAVITAVCEAAGCQTADVYGAFTAATEDVLNSEVTVYGLDLDDHPNASGHRLIADAFLKEIDLQ